MTYREACTLFYHHGNVALSIEDLVKGRPLEWQIDAACQVAISRGQDPEIVEQAKRAIMGIDQPTTK